MSTQPQQLIQKLLKAEADAEGIIAKARENRVKRLRDAKSAADEEISLIRQKEEEKFNADHQGMQGSITDDYTQMQKINEAALEVVKRSYVSNGKLTSQYMLERVLSVTPVLSQSQIPMLRAKS